MERNAKAREKFKKDHKFISAQDELSTDEKLAKMREQKCIWPRCKKLHAMMCTLPPHVKNEQGQWLANGDENGHIAMGVPLCMKHAQYAMSGLAILVADDPKNLGLVRLWGDFEGIRQTESLVSMCIFEERMIRDDAQAKRLHQRAAHICPHCLDPTPVQHDTKPYDFRKARFNEEGACAGCKHINECSRKLLEYYPEDDDQDEEEDATDE